MSLLVLIAATSALIAAGAACYEARRARLALTEPTGLTGRSVVVSTAGETAVRGIVHADLVDRLTLRDAVVLTVGQDAGAPADGLVHFYRDQVAMVQELPLGRAAKA